MYFRTITIVLCFVIQGCSFGASDTQSSRVYSSPKEKFELTLPKGWTIYWAEEDSSQVEGARQVLMAFRTTTPGEGFFSILGVRSEDDELGAALDKLVISMERQYSLMGGYFRSSGPKREGKIGDRNASAIPYVSRRTPGEELSGFAYVVPASDRELYFILGGGTNKQATSEVRKIIISISFPD